MRCTGYNGAAALVAVFTLMSASPISGFPAGQSDVARNGIRDLSGAAVAGLPQTAPVDARRERDLSSDLETLNGLEKRKGGGGGKGGGGKGGGKGGDHGSAPSGKGPGGREGGKSGEGENGGPPRGGHSPNSISGTRDVGGRFYGTGYGRGGIGGGFAGVFLSVALLSLLFVDVAANLVLEAGYIYLLTSMVGYELHDTVKYMPGFQNSNSNGDKDDKWPQYDKQPKPEDNSQPVSALWSLRTFADDSCGSNGNDPYATGKGKHGQPVMISEYISTDLNYHDGKACENFMVLQDAPSGVIVQSVAVWFDPSYAAPNAHQGVISIYSDPLCRTDLDPKRTSANAPNGTVHTTYSDDFPDYMQLYTGVGLVNGKGDEQPGQWNCYQIQANAFHVVFAGITNNKATLTGENGTVAAADTTPTPGKNSPHDVFADRGGGTFLTTDITKTFQVQ